MDKISKIIVTISLLVTATMGYLYFSKPKPFSIKAIVNCPFTYQSWDMYIFTYRQQALKLVTGKLDSAQLKSTADTIALLTNIIATKIQDSSVNPILYSK